MTSTRGECSRSGIGASPRALRADLSERRLLILSPTTGRGGAEDYLLTVSDGAVAAGWEVTVCVERLEGTASLVDDLYSRPGLHYVDAKVGSGVRRELPTLIRQAVPLARLLR